MSMYRMTLIAPTMIRLIVKPTSNGTRASRQVYTTFSRRTSITTNILLMQVSRVNTPNALNSALRVREGGQYLRGIGTGLADLGKATAQVLTPAPTVLAGGERIIGEPGIVQAAREMLPRATARYRQEGLLQPATADILSTMMARSLRQAGGLEAGGLLGD